MTLDHVAVLTSSIEQFCTVNQLHSQQPIDVFEDVGSRELYIDDDHLGGRLLLMQPHGPGPYDGALAKRGPGLHHLGIAASDLQGALAEWTARGWQVHPEIAMDIRGHGRSQAPDGPFTLADLSDDLHRLLVQLDLPEAPIVVGHSLGGMIVQQYAVDHPAAHRGIIVIDADVNTSGARRQLLSATSVLGAWAMWAAAALLGEHRSLALCRPLWGPVSFSRAWRRSNPAIVREESRKFALHNTLDGLAWALIATGSRPDLTGGLARLPGPSLIIRGSQDLLMSQRRVERLHDALPGSRLELVPGAGHVSITEQPQTVVDLMSEFLEAAA